MKIKTKIKLLFILFLLISLTGFINQSDDKNQQLIIFHAGSLTVPFDKIIKQFKKENPGVVVVREVAGSRECAKKISDLNKPCDVFASADYIVIDNLLIPSHTKWNMKFATNEMAIVFTEKSKYAKKIKSTNWYKILEKKEVSIGRADPDSDPCGYRTVLTLKLSDMYYKDNTISKVLLEKNNENIRPKEVDLIALLETGQLDYIFLYRSVAEQHGLKYILLPDEINLKNPKLDDLYKKVNVEVKGKKPGETITHSGASMIYGVTIPNNAPNKKLAIKFVQFLMNDKKGLKIMRENGQPTIVRSKSEYYDNIPKELQKFVTK